MSSWLDTKKFVTSLAKTAMAEAQKTLDKALDITDEERLEQENNQNNLEQNDDDFKQTFDQWGSFTGSFFNLNDSKKKQKGSQMFTFPSKKSQILLLFLPGIDPSGNSVTRYLFSDNKAIFRHYICQEDRILKMTNFIKEKKPNCRVFV